MIDFTEEELYIIERTFDMLYSQLDRNYVKVAEQFMLAKASGEDEVAKELCNKLFRINSSGELHRSVSNKISKWRNG